MNKLIASEGMTLTNGEALGKVVYLADGDSPDNWYEITDEEAEAIREAEDDPFSPVYETFDTAYQKGVDSV